MEVKAADFRVGDVIVREYNLLNPTIYCIESIDGLFANLVALDETDTTTELLPDIAFECNQRYRLTNTPYWRMPTHDEMKGFLNAKLAQIRAKIATLKEFEIQLALH